MEFDFLTIFINIATATISQVLSLSSSFSIVFFFVWHFAVNKLVIVRKGVPVPPFKAPTPWPSLLPPFKNLCFPSPLFCSNPSKGILDSSTTLLLPPPALIWPTNLPWFKQISKGWFYQFNCLLYCLNLKSFASLFFLIEGNFEFIWF